MKKIYVAPCTKVMKINVEQMICQSQLGVGTTYTDTTILNKEEPSDYSDDLW